MSADKKRLGVRKGSIVVGPLGVKNGTIIVRIIRRTTSHYVLHMPLQAL